VRRPAVALLRQDPRVRDALTKR